MPDFSRRSHQAELMDDLSLEGAALAQNLEELEVINRWLGGNEVVINALDKVVKTTTWDGDYLQVVDLGTGGGDLPRRIARWARKRKIPIRITGVDANPFMVSFSKEKAKAYPEIQFEEVDIFSPSFQQRRYDIVISSLFCHHFTDPQLVSLFQQMQAQSRLAFIVNDLHRHPLAYHGIRLLTRWLGGSYLVRHDAPLSVARAFKKQELKGLLKQAAITSYQLSWRWAFRYQIIGRVRS
jgi:2-polyprenyl-3-methyl-5-hydroxy-6-metoxy-1,4-benzoquinol methylase